MPSHVFPEPTPVGRERVEILVADWEIECCAPQPAVGEDTSWMLEFAPGWTEPFLDRELSWTVSRWNEHVTRLDRGGTTAYWAFGAGPPPAPGPVRLRGRLQGTRHGGISPDGFPLCTGRVDRVRLLSQEYVEYADRHWRGVPGTVTAQDVDRSPRWFNLDVSMTAGTPRPFAVLLDVVPGLPASGPG